MNKPLKSETKRALYRAFKLHVEGIVRSQLAWMAARYETEQNFESSIFTNELEHQTNRFTDEAVQVIGRQIQMLKDAGIQFEEVASYSQLVQKFIDNIFVAWIPEAYIDRIAKMANIDAIIDEFLRSTPGPLN